MGTQRAYECTILVHSGQARADYDGALAEVRSLYETEGAEWIELDKWEERRLTYPVKGETSALYLFGYFNADSGIVERIERRCQLSELVLRQLILVRDGKAYDAIRAQRAKVAERRERAIAED